jgi:hypothetical protein
VNDRRYNIAYINRIESKITGRARIYDAETKVSIEVPIGNVKLLLLGGLEFDFEITSPLKLSERLALHVNKILKREHRPLLKLIESGETFTVYSNSS